MGGGHAGAGLRSRRHRGQTGGEPGRSGPRANHLCALSAAWLSGIRTRGDPGAELDHEAVADPRRQRARRAALLEGDIAAAADQCPVPREGVPSGGSLRGPAGAVPRITRLLALALKFEDLIRSGTVGNYAALAQVARVSRARVTQMTSLLNLAPDIQEEILFLPTAAARQLRICEPSLRKLTATLLWNQQREQWRELAGSRKPPGSSLGNGGIGGVPEHLAWINKRATPPSGYPAACRGTELGVQPFTE